MPEVFVSIGSNVEPHANVRAALRLMTERFGALRVSRVYESEPVGFNGPRFHNLVVGFDTHESLAEVTAALDAIELQRGRQRGAARFAARTLDLDVLVYGDLIHAGTPCTVPRADILRYAFVLRPLAEIAGQRLHPQLGRSYAQLWSEFDEPGQRLWPAPPAVGAAAAAGAS